MRKSKEFGLLEWMISLVMVSLLAALAVPSYVRANNGAFIGLAEDC